MLSKHESLLTSDEAAIPTDGINGMCRNIVPDNPIHRQRMRVYT